MKITILAVGRMRPGPERALFDHYRKRLTWSVAVKEIEDRRGGPADQTREAKLLTAACPEPAIRIALDERGNTLTSRAFAARLDGWRVEGRREIAFFIGGADGLAEEIRANAELVLSFGAATWPHFLVRGLLAEQLYRAETILAGHPYHRD